MPKRNHLLTTQVDLEDVLNRLRLEFPLYEWTYTTGKTFPDTDNPERTWFGIEYKDNDGGNGIYWTKEPEHFTELGVRNLLKGFKVSIENYKLHKGDELAKKTAV